MKKEYRNVVRTKKMIRKAFMELLEEKNDIEHISVVELTERADLSKSTFYYHYEDIFAVAEEIESELFDKFLEVLGQIKKEQPMAYEAHMKAVIAFLKEHEDMYRRVIVSSYSHLFVDKLKSVLTKKTLESSQNASFAHNANVWYVRVRFLTNAFVDTISDYFKGMLSVSLEEVGEIMLGLIDGMLKTDVKS